MNKITVTDLNLYYGQFHALKGINLAFPAREITALIGPSGCGKSTLLKTLNRMNDLVEGCRITGSVKLDDQEVYGGMDVNTLRKRVGMVFQKPNPFPMSIYDNIAYGPRTHGVRSRVMLDEIVEKSLTQAAIWDEVKDRLKKSRSFFAPRICGERSSGGHFTLGRNRQKWRICISQGASMPCWPRTLYRRWQPWSGAKARTVLWLCQDCRMASWIVQ